MTLEIPNGDWTFKSVAVCKNFGSHVREQLPWYDLMTGAVAHFARHYIAEESIVYDLGCSTGNIGKALAKTINERRARLIAVDNASAMGDIYEGGGVFKCEELEAFEPEPFSVAVCFLSLMFVKKKDRTKLVERLRKKCLPGGAIIVVDKIEQSGGFLGTAVNRLTLAAKLSTGTSPSDIIAKELSLSGIQRPLARDEVFGAQVFQFGEFVGFVWES